LRSNIDPKDDTKQNYDAEKNAMFDLMIGFMAAIVLSTIITAFYEHEFSKHEAIGGAVVGLFTEMIVSTLFEKLFEQLLFGSIDDTTTDFITDLILSWQGIVIGFIGGRVVTKSIKDINIM
jgi:Na+/proline symporter